MQPVEEFDHVMLQLVECASGKLLASLRDDFPKNPLFAKEIARLDSGQ